jgi:hypothetical protein
LAGEAGLHFDAYAQSGTADVSVRMIPNEIGAIVMSAVIRAAPLAVSFGVFDDV